MIDGTVMELLAGFAIALVLMVAEYLLCTKMKNPLWGGIIPGLILAGSVCVFASSAVPLELRYTFLFVILNTVFFGDWGTGRDKYQKMQQKEIEYMRAKDL